MFKCLSGRRKKRKKKKKINSCNQLITVKSPAGWATAEEYLSDDLASEARMASNSRLQDLELEK